MTASSTEARAVQRQLTAADASRMRYLTLTDDERFSSRFERFFSIFPGF